MLNHNTLQYLTGHPIKSSKEKIVEYNIRSLQYMAQDNLLGKLQNFIYLYLYLIYLLKVYLRA